LRGLKGTLSSQGKFSGPLDYLTVEGETKTPQFGLRTTSRPVPLQTTFTAIVDGTNGSTVLKNVAAQFLNTRLAVSGEVVDTSPELKGQTIRLDVTSESARVEDLLRLVAVKSEEPPMTGAAQLKAHLDIPEGDVDLLDRMKLSGQFGVGGARFTTPNVQGQIDTLSRKGQGQPQNEDISAVVSALQGAFQLSNGVATFSRLSFDVTGASLRLGGTYNLDSGEMNFHGQLRLQAKPSQTTTGTKSFFLKAIDPFFKGKNAGTVLPIKITGTKDNPSFGLDRGGDSKTDQPEPPKIGK
jgi:hypothetical protein